MKEQRDGLIMQTYILTLVFCIASTTANTKVHAEAKASSSTTPTAKAAHIIADVRESGSQTQDGENTNVELNENTLAERQLWALQSTVSQLSLTVSSISNTARDLQSVNTRHANEIEAVKLENRELKSTLEILRQKTWNSTGELQYQLERKTEELYAKLTTISETISSTDPAIGFTAYAIEGRTYIPNDVVMFEGVLSNFGSAYDSVFSVFTCPYHGIYFFTVGFNAEIEMDFWADIIRESYLFVRAIAHDSDHWSHASAFGIEECYAGNRVWVEAGTTGGLLGGSAHSSHFSGYLLHRLS